MTNNEKLKLIQAILMIIDEERVEEAVEILCKLANFDPFLDDNQLNRMVIFKSPDPFYNHICDLDYIPDEDEEDDIIYKLKSNL